MPPFLKNIVHDLIEKRLWPVALALVVALIAVPIVLGGSSASAPAVASAPLPGAGNGRSSVSLATAAGQERAYTRAGKVRNPFSQPKVKRAGTATTTAPGGSPTTTTAGTPSGGSPLPAGSPGTGDPGAPGGTPGSGGGTKPDSLDTFRLTLRFGQAGSLRTISDLARLSPLPSEANPFFVYLGVLKDAKTAVFLISSDVTATGDGKCRPSTADCQTVEVKEGDTEFFDLERDGNAIQYEMDVLHLVRTSDAAKQVTAAAARAAATRHSKAGAAMLRSAHADGKQDYAGMDGYRWLPDRGVLARVPAGAKASSTTGAAAAARKTLPGLPVWHAELTV